MPRPLTLTGNQPIDLADFDPRAMDGDWDKQAADGKSRRIPSRLGNLTSGFVWKTAVRFC